MKRVLIQSLIWGVLRGGINMLASADRLLGGTVIIIIEGIRFILYCGLWLVPTTKWYRRPGAFTYAKLNVLFLSISYVCAIVFVIGSLAYTIDLHAPLLLYHNDLCNII
jgi:hypothetical protein